MTNFNPSQKSSSWAPLVIGTLVVLIILCAIYYYYYSKVNKDCVKEYIKFTMPMADDDTVNQIAEWKSANGMNANTIGVCETGYAQLAPPPGSSCTICEVVPAIKLPENLQNKARPPTSMS
jgi:hypothetical protein